MKKLSGIYPMVVCFCKGGSSLSEWDGRRKCEIIYKSERNIKIWQKEILNLSITNCLGYLRI